MVYGWAISSVGLLSSNVDEHNPLQIRVLLGQASPGHLLVAAVRPLESRDMAWLNVGTTLAGSCRLLLTELGQSHGAELFA